MPSRRAALCFLWIAAACAPSRPAAAPSVEFVVTTADSAFWVTSDRKGMHVRGVPMVLARVDGRFHEIYVADDDRSFYDAVFVGQRIFARDIASGDSTELFADTVVAGLAREYASAHPREEPLTADEEASARPRTTATADLEVLEVHGPYLSFEYHSDVDFTGEREGAVRRADRHTVRRRVVDLRDGTVPALAALFGKDAATRATAAAEQEWARVRDSLRTGGEGPVRPAAQRPARPAARARSAFEFDAESFSLASTGGAPGIVFAVPGESSGGPLRPIVLSPQPVAAPAWWRDAAADLPTGADSLRRWTRGRLSVVAELDSAGDRARLTLHDSTQGRWNIAAVTAPVERVFWLDASVSAESRKALRRAFNEASSYAEDSRVAAAPFRAERHGERYSEGRIERRYATASANGTSTSSPSRAQLVFGNRSFASRSSSDGSRE